MHAYTYMYMKGKKNATYIIAALDNLLNCTLLHTRLQSSLWLLSENQSERRTEENYHQKTMWQLSKLTLKDSL